MFRDFPIISPGNQTPEILWNTIQHCVTYICWEITLMPAFRRSSRVGRTDSWRRSSTPVKHRSSISRSRLSITAVILAWRSWMLILAWWYRFWSHHNQTIHYFILLFYGTILFAGHRDVVCNGQGCRVCAGPKIWIAKVANTCQLKLISHIGSLLAT